MMTLSSFYEAKCKKRDQKYVDDFLNNIGVLDRETNNMLLLAVVQRHLALVHAVHSRCRSFQKRRLSRIIKRKRQSVAQVFRELGNENLFHHAYRMTKAQFYDLFQLLESKMQVSMNQYYLISQWTNSECH